MPNGQGGFGVPRYIKAAAPSTADMLPIDDEAIHAARARSMSNELSASASEFVSNAAAR